MVHLQYLITKVSFECLWVIAEVTEQKKKRMKTETDISKYPPVVSMRNQLELAAGLKGEQVCHV